MSTSIGLIGAVALLSFVILHEGSDSSFVDPTGIVIVFGGTVVAGFLAFRLSEIKDALSAAATMFREDHVLDRDLADLVAFARATSRHSIADAEARLRAMRSPFLKIGLQMCLDGASTDDILNVMNWRVQKFAEQEGLPARFYRTLAGFAPAFGLLATLTGLIGMMAKLGTADVRAVGASMAIALLATFYGLILANLIFKPIAIKLETRTQRRIQMLNVMLAGIVLLRVGKSPTMIQDSLDAMLREVRDEVGNAD
ncbi:MAG: MotA/TolQ/ExbB proton channel family protein [Rhodospirillales bacterium]|nr:MotA/TolQ/ExbB proton channel family protein [Rhodospirillales bacterium]